MKNYITKDNLSLTGYGLLTINDDGTEHLTPINKLVEDGHTLALPDNSTGRKYFSIVKAASADRVELTPRNERVNSTTSTPRQSKISFTDDDLALLSPETVQIIKDAYDSLKVNREKAKLQALITKYEAMKAELEAKLST